MVGAEFTARGGAWRVACLLGVGPGDMAAARSALLRAGCPPRSADGALRELRGLDAGYTFSDLGRRASVMLAGRASSAAQMYDTLQHELRHVVEHACEGLGVDGRSEEAAYIQGEIARKMFPAAAAVCPACRGLKDHDGGYFTEVH